MEPQQQRGTLVQAGARPLRLRAAGTCEGLGDVVCGMTASGLPVAGSNDVTPLTVLAMIRLVSAATYSGSNAYDARGSCSGSAGSCVEGFRLMSRG